MAWEKEQEALRDHMKMQARLQEEFVAALFRVADEFDADPAQLAMSAQNTMHVLFHPLSQIQHQRAMREHAEAQRRAQGAAPEEAG